MNGDFFETIVTKTTTPEDLFGPVELTKMNSTAPDDLLGPTRSSMTRTAAIHRVAVLAGGISQGDTGIVYRFRDLDKADAAHDLLNVLDPGCTGDVFHDGRLVVQPTTTFDDQRTERIEYLRGEIRAERISYGEIIELQGLVAFIDPDDGELMSWVESHDGSEEE